MFFTQELLSRRDSGFGLLWLAATLGSKSSFRKLPRRSVVTADIAELCQLIAEPPEPLALRLSSNLMIGVTRVYKVKQDIFLTDVTACFHTLKKAVQELYDTSVTAEQLQMGQPSARPDTVTMVADPSAQFAMDFDHLFAAWEDWSTQKAAASAQVEGEEDFSDDDFDPTNKSQKKGKARARDTPLSIDRARGNAHTLKENHELLLSASFDASFHDDGFGGFGAVGPSSSQFDGGFGFEDNILEGMDVGDVGDIGDELAKELGEGWGAPLEDAGMQDNGPLVDVDIGGPPGPDMNFEFGGDLGPADPPSDISPSGLTSAQRTNQALQGAATQDQPFVRDGSVVVPLSPLRPDDADNQLGEDATEGPVKRKGKRVRLLLDARTELTNEELQKARAHYLQEQAALRKEIAQKKAEKESERILAEMISGVPRGLNAPVLVDFWMENFKLQVEARSGRLHMETEGEPPAKRRRIAEDKDDHGIDPDVPLDMELRDEAQDLNLGPGINEYGMGGDNLEGIYEPDFRLRSSEEPGQARNASRPPSVLGGSHFNLNLQAGTQVSGSQRSGFFPWDHAGVSSSVAGAFDLPGSDRISLGRPPRGSSLSSRGRESPFHPGISGIGLGEDNGPGPLEGDFEFDVGDKSLQGDTQQSDLNVVTLERNSLNFLEYAKMQLNAMPAGTIAVGFDDVVPKATSTPHVAAAAFYHCLALATKKLIRVKQDEAFGPLDITVV
ncbi:hypothetical protein K474DRAFT_1708496 [Panus rudis PR-1116 ss-1]|nr:hypothetical protein K474DRAFT_1708496 [Panus rudis PR-1116 ss-1]